MKKTHKLIFLFVLSMLFLHTPLAFSRVAFLSDAHAVVDAKDRNIQWNENTKTRIRSLFFSEKLRPDHIIWLGDMIDFLPAEWRIVETWVNWIESNYKVNQYGLMGNHDYVYYNYPEIQGRFNRGLNNRLVVNGEIESNLSRSSSAGDKKLYVNNASDFLVNREVILIQTPDFDDKNKFQIGVIGAINKKENSITLKSPVENSFSKNTTAVRQGFSERRGISSFKKAFSKTKSKDTKSVFYIGNTVFILLSMDAWFSQNLESKGQLITASDMVFLERQLQKHQKTHNIVVVMHELPDDGASLGGMHDPNKVIEFDRPTRKKLRSLVKRYEVAAWVSGHTHPNARTDVVNHHDGTTTFILSPSVGTNTEGQILILDLVQGEKKLRFQYWSVDKGDLIKEITAPVKHVIAHSRASTDR